MEVSQQFWISILIVILGWNLCDPGPTAIATSVHMALAAILAAPPTRVGLVSRDSWLASGLLCKKDSRALKLKIFLLIKYWLFSWPQKEISASFPRLLHKTKWIKQLQKIVNKSLTYNRKSIMVITNAMFKAQKMRGTLHSTAIIVRNHVAGGRFTSPEPKWSMMLNPTEAEKMAYSEYSVFHFKNMKGRDTCIIKDGNSCNSFFFEFLYMMSVFDAVIW